MTSAETPFETSIIISATEIYDWQEYGRLPAHINVVDPFKATEIQTVRLATRISEPLLRNNFDISCLETNGRGARRLQRLGGSVLHNIREEIVEALDELDIAHTNLHWPEATNKTWYSGTWSVPKHTTKINHVYLAQESLATEKWRVLRTYNLPKPSSDFRHDPLYIDSLFNPVQKRGA